MKVLTIARVELLRLLRDRSNLFFVLVLPLLLVVLIGASFGGAFDTRIGLVAPEGDEAAAAFATALEAGGQVVTVRYDDRETLVEEVSRNRISAGVAIPEGYERALSDADPVEIAFIGRPDATSVSLQQLVAAVVTEQAAATNAAVLAAQVTDVPVGQLVPIARLVHGQLPRIDVTTQEVGGDELAREFAGLGQFDLGASTQLILFTFLTALTGGTALIQTRQLGLASRMLSTPTSIGAILGGQAAGRIAVALFQALYIVVTTALLFQVDWGTPLPTISVIVLFSIVAGAAGMLVGATARNDAQAGGLGIGLGIGLAALGGSMVPLEIFPGAVRTVAHVTPHAWANRAMAEIVRRDGTLLDIGLELGMLALFAVVLLVLASWRLHRVLVR